MTKPIKVLVIAHDAELGGAQRSLLEILERLNPQSYLSIVVGPTPGPFVQAVRDLGITCYWGLTQRWVFFKKSMGATVILKKPWRLLMNPYLWTFISLVTMPLRIAMLIVLARKEGVKLIYSNTITVMDGALLARILGVPHVWHLREAVDGNPDLSYPFSVDWLPGLILRWSQRVIVNSNSLQAQLFGVEKHDKVRVIWNGVDFEARFDHMKRPSLAFIPSGSRITAICGRLHKRKGILVYLGAAARLKETHPDVHHLVIGEGQPEYMLRLREETLRLELTDRVHFLGYRQDIYGLLSRVDILVNASTLEPFGRTVLEAMAMAVPVIATRSGGPEEIIVDGESGYLVEVDDEAAIADRMSGLLDDEQLSHSMGTAGQQRVMKHFDLKKAIDEIEEVFDEALSNSTLSD